MVVVFALLCLISMPAALSWWASIEPLTHNVESLKQEGNLSVIA